MEVLTGRLTADATLNEISNGRKVINFTIAINDRYKPKDAPVKELTRFVKCAYWTNFGIAAFLKKGTLVELTGRIDLQVWKDKQGEPKGILTLYVNGIKLHGRSKMQEAAVSTPVDQQPATADDLPF